jgi:predicted GNAT superfamily acetyltransferase
MLVIGDTPSVYVTLLESLDDLRAATGALARIWGRSLADPPVSRDVLRALTHSGNYVAGAYQGDELTGVSVGVLGLSGGSLHLHSVVTGVLPGHRGRHVGFALKQHQRAWAIERGIDAIGWTFDPLVRSNAFFNLTKLGAEVVGYRPNFYGEMEDAFNAGDETDRAVVWWALTSPRAMKAAAGGGEELDVAALRAEGATVILDEGPTVHAVAGDLLLARVPEDIVSLRRSHPEAARAWRRAGRDSFGRAVAQGYVATAMTRSGWYVLKRRG